MLLPKNIERCQWVNRYCRIKVLLNVAGTIPKLYSAKAQQIAGMLCPVILIFMILLVNNNEIMKEYTNNKLQNIIVYITVIFIITLSTVLFIYPVLEKLIILWR